MSVNKNADGTWYFSVRIIDRYGQVKQIKRQNKNWKLKRDAIDAEREFINNNQMNSDTITYNQLFSSFISYKTNKIKKRSILTYEEVNRLHIIPYFGNMRISQITKENIRSWQQKLIEKGFGNVYLSKIQTNFKHVLIWGLNHDLITKNPFTIEYAKREAIKKEMDYFTLDEFNQFISVIENEVDRLIFEVFYWCGVRKGELQALTFDDIDLANKTLRINKQFDNMNRIVTTPKNQTSYRTIYLPDFLYKKLNAFVIKSMKIAGFSGNLYLFGYDKHTSATTIERKKNLYCKKAGVKQIRIHDFRHSHVSLMINNKENDFDIAKRLGHSREMVNNVYGHWFDDSQIKLAGNLDTIHSNGFTKGSQIMEHEDIGKKLAKLRISNDLSLETVCNQLNMAINDYLELESGEKQISVEQLIKISEFYKVKADSLLFNNTLVSL